MGFPVFNAFAAGLTYIFTQFFTLLRILWLPALLMLAVNITLFPTMMAEQVALFDTASDADPEAVFNSIAPLFKYMGVMYLVAAIFYPMMMAGVLRHVTRGETPKLPFYLRFGSDELRIILATVLLILLVFALNMGGGILFGFIFLIVAFAASAIAEQLMFVGLGIGLVIIFFAYIWFMVRMSIIYAAAIGERKIGIVQSWELTAGNFWGLSLYWLLWSFLAMFLFAAYMMVIMPGYFSMMFEMLSSISETETSTDFPMEVLAAQEGMWDLSDPSSWPNLAISYFGTIVYMIIWMVPGGIAYRYLSNTAGRG